ncbi:hypothetical protein GX51_06412 [Blastomyces parvus]|uniref:Uncharacterized protein n=1 Tax=Blastomyces parvus TaxID=2060905 RepID=A0A2B7WIF0_9EURO|nr:hypothetical protein GX51_06412 [Blastomyces parvus]
MPHWSPASTNNHWTDNKDAIRQASTTVVFGVVRARANVLPMDAARVLNAARSRHGFAFLAIYSPPHA